jgi:hypothetical protein
MRAPVIIPVFVAKETGTLPNDLAIITAIIFAARLSRRVPETSGEKRRTIAESMVDAMLILEVTVEDEDGADFRLSMSRLLEAEPEQPPPSPGTIGRIAEAKATRRRG